MAWNRIEPGGGSVSIGVWPGLAGLGLHHSCRTDSEKMARTTSHYLVPHTDHPMMYTRGQDTSTMSHTKATAAVQFEAAITAALLVPTPAIQPRTPNWVADSPRFLLHRQLSLCFIQKLAIIGTTVCVRAGFVLTLSLRIVQGENEMDFKYHTHR